MKKTDRDLLLLAFACVVTIYALVTLISSVVPRKTVDQPAVEEVVQQEPAPETTAEPADDDAREVFVSTWAERIDAFNAGYPLEGYGRTFAEAAYDYGIDPRLPPAIARVESGSGEVCFNPYNAWGWGDASWGDWDSAIRGFTASFAEGYGYTLSYEMAEVYNQANVDEWYNWVASCMAEIWESDSL